MLYLIIGITVIISILAFYNEELFNKLKFNAYEIKNYREGWRFFSYGFLHAGWVHLFINMFVLYSFGDVVEGVFRYTFGLKGIFYFVLLYAGSIIFSVLFDYRKHLDNPYYSAVGASGAVSAIVFSSIILYPSGSIYLFLIPIPIPSPVFGILYLIYSAYMSKKAQDNIGHSAHFWGAIFGVVFTIIIKPQFALGFWESLFG